MSDIDISPRVIDLICSRICHDLISPISAINNGIELMGEEDGIGGDAFSLIADSAAIAASRLSVMRFAFGAASPALADIREVAVNYFADSKVALVWSKEPMGGELAERQGLPKLLLNVILVLAESIAAWGTVTIVDGGSGKIIVQGDPKSGSIRGDVLSGLDAPLANELDARTIQAFATSLQARRFGFTLDRDVQKDKVIFTIS